jgi:hypothetical protein
MIDLLNPPAAETPAASEGTPADAAPTAAWFITPDQMANFLDEYPHMEDEIFRALSQLPKEKLDRLDDYMELLPYPRAMKEQTRWLLRQKGWEETTLNKDTARRVLEDLHRRRRVNFIYALAVQYLLIPQFHERREKAARLETERRRL